MLTECFAKKIKYDFLPFLLARKCICYVLIEQQKLWCYASERKKLNGSEIMLLDFVQSTPLSYTHTFNILYAFLHVLPIAKKSSYFIQIGTISYSFMIFPKKNLFYRFVEFYFNLMLWVAYIICLALEMLHSLQVCEKERERRERGEKSILSLNIDVTTLNIAFK